MINTKTYVLNFLNTIWTDVDRSSLTMYKYTCPRSRFCWYGPVGAGWRSFLPPPHSAACWWRLPASCGPGDHRRLCLHYRGSCPPSIHAGPWVAPIKHGIRVYHKKIDKRSMRKNHMGGAQVQFPVKWATMAKDAGSPVIEILANTSSLSS